MKKLFPVLVLLVVTISAAWAIEKPAVIYVSWGDEIVVGNGDGKLDSPEKIARMMRFWRNELGADIILWRISSEWLMKFCDFAFSSYHLKLYQRLGEEFNAMEVAVKEAHHNGMKILAYQTIFDQGMPSSSIYGGRPYPWQSKFIKSHPEYQVVNRAGTKYQYGVAELAYPEMRRQITNEVKYFMDTYGFDGIYWCTRTHSKPVLQADEMGFGEPVVTEFKKRYTIDIRNQDFDLTLWRKLRGEFFVKFLEESREMFPGKIMAVGIPRGQYFGPPYGNMYLDYESIIKRKLVDYLIIGVWSGAWLYPEFPHDYPKMGYLYADETNFNIPSWSDAIEKIYGPLCRKHGIKLVASSGNNNLLKYPELDSLMLDCPTPLGGLARLPHSDLLAGNGGQLTIELRVNPSGVGTTLQTIRHILSKYHHEKREHRGYQISLLADGRVQFRFQDINGNDISLYSKSKIPLLKWTHIAGVIDKANKRARLYVNGKLEDDTTNRVRSITGIRNNPAIDLYLGRYGGYNDHNFEGMIDEFIIWPFAKEFTDMPAKPYSDQELKKAVAAFRFDSAENGIVKNYGSMLVDLEIIKADGSIDPNIEMADSETDFGNALKISIKELK